MMRRFLKWFGVSWLVQALFIVLAMSTGFLSILVMPYWAAAMVIGYSLGLPEKGIASVALAFGLAIVPVSLLIGLLGILLLKFPGERNASSD
jgi:hypothetical protein